MFVDHNLWPAAPSEPTPQPKRRLSDAEEKRIGWAIVVFVLIMFAGPLAGSSVIVAAVAVWRAFVG
ncbi:hypothetical protein SAMN04488241_1192 [Sphingomonas rubra]|uniref:Uncharacterized protein n=2 Tax=Sphingomonas rubra TaxID=634430 RepID=A0A1I5UWL5_9SPHN|nr:hypothetical protein SAMN04488241_1192 [Sphingomonas rubra]